MSRAVKDNRERQLVDKMANLRVGQEELRRVSDIQLQVEERMVQVIGHFFKYDAILDKNIPVKEGVFLCIDRVLTGEGGTAYIIHVVDQTGQLSYCRSEISSDRGIQLNQGDQVLFWVGDAKPDGSVPAWVFYIAEAASIGPLKGIVVKALQEVNFLRMQEANAKRSATTKATGDSSSEDGGADAEWLQAQLMADAQPGDVSMEGGQEVVDDFQFAEDWNDPDRDDGDDQAEEGLCSGYDLDDDELQHDADLDADLRDGDNKECLQAMQYDRAFVLSGPVVRVYKNSDDQDADNQQRLKYLMHLPVVKDPKTGEVIEPRNLALHNNESSLLFLDSKDKNRVINYDLEKGQIADEYHTKEALGDLGLDQIVNEAKNGQTTAA